MPYDLFDLNPVDRLTADAIGEPGKRVFYMQGRKGRRLVTLICEKQQVAALAVAIEQFLLALADNDADKVVEPDPADEERMHLEIPLEVAFRVGQVNLSYDQRSGRMVVTAYEAQEEGETDPPSVARFWATPAQMRAFAIQGQRVVLAGRPICAMCGEPIDAEGHFCLRRNGDKH